MDKLPLEVVYDGRYSPEGKLILKDYVSAEDTYKEFKPTTFDSYSFDK